MTITPQIPEDGDRIRPIQFITAGKQTNLPAPFIRVTACGLLTIEVVEAVINTDPPQARYVSLSADQLRGRGTAPALTLLKLLLSRPERFALRDWLVEQFCHDRELFSSVRLDNIVSQLRSLLCPPAYEELRTQIVAHARGSASSGDGYQLAAYPLIWTDLDALTWNVEQAARMERFGDDPLPYWERAYALARRGIFLPDERYSDWAAARLGEVAGMLRQSVQALARLYLERHGKTGEEEALLVLRSYWQEHPREEDVLRPLMELLGQRECYQEALEYYEQLKSLLEADDCQPDPRTQDVAAYLKTKQIQRSSLQTARLSPQKVSATGHTNKVLSPSEEVRPDLLVPFPIDFQYGIMQAISDLEGTTDVAFDPLRRKTLRTIATAILAATGSLPSDMGISDPDAWERFVSGQQTPSVALNREILEHFEHLVLLSRQLGKGQQHDITVAKTISASCLPTLTALAQQSSPQQKQAADLAAQCYRLHAILAYHTENLATAEASAKQAVFCSQIAGIPDLLVTSLTFHAQVLYYGGNPEHALGKCLEAEQFLDQTTYAVQSYLYRIKAACLAQLAQEKQAQATLHLAHEMFYRHPAAEKPFVYAAHDEYELLLWDGITRYQIDQPDEAERSWGQAHFQMPSKALPERVRTGFLNNLVFAELRKPGSQRDMERCIALWHDALKATLDLQSELRYGEVVRAYNEMRIAFPGETRLKGLREQLRKWQ
jgi:DNA-binding SARP family transcriptional activator